MAFILIVDDDADVRHMVATTLTREGYLVAELTDGALVSPFLSDNKPDLILTDIMMMEKEGLEMIREIREFDNSTPIIAMSSGGMAGEGLYLEIAVKLGANAAIEKPFQPRELLELIRGQLNKPA